ncbi:asparagine synthetase B family protein [Aquabacter cavernae]|uniref:asparagine synthetase B family protein n=1 Tax=Aquabacter cavernae TaxID=2496029 RepID=UPI000F8E9392|nr:asparagine synthetase B [Aquabacter cavernae]
MSAICGLARWDRRPDAAADCAAMQRALASYGADRVAAWDGGDVALGIGLARLLPEDRHDCQPLSGGAGRWRLVADMRLDNRPELAARLGIDAADAARLADSDLLLRAWEKWEQEAPHHLVGDYAFAVWDRLERRLHLVRDFLGHRPLFYHLGAGFAAFASMARGLHALDGIFPAPDLDRIRDYLALAPMRGEASFFAGISRVEPGERVVIGPDGRVTRHVWYDWSRIRTVRFGRDEDYVEAFRETFDRAVGARLRTDGRIATHLSGGLDSTAVTATAAGLLAGTGQRLRAFTHVPLSGVPLADEGRRNGNEWALAHELARGYPNIDHVAVEAADRTIGGDLDAQFHHFEYPALNLCNLVWMREIARQAGRGGRGILLSGGLGNATLSLSGVERVTELFISGRWLTWFRESLALTRNGHSLAGAFVGRTLAPLMPRRLYRAMMRARGAPPLGIAGFSALRPDVRESDAFKARMMALGYDPNFRPWRSVRGVSAFMLRRLDISCLEQKGQLAAFGVDVRDPTTDQRLVEFIHGVPSDQFLRNGQSKWLYHRAFAARVPQALRASSLRGLQAADWHERFRQARADLGQEFSLARDNAGVRALLDVGVLEGALQEGLPAGVPDAGTTQRLRLQLLRSLSVAHFMRRTERGNGAPPAED